eukprot:TRINITY_DN6289_c0_g1_i2.p1 TRINITY_DN6289_c0_g1~~TRINITY_DN6289_c0_g1_i2.p1  ORF type:complete len:778 (-),score=157.98 TRINITY_DN6289_c0_g1_i2:54-2387(-)
MAVALMSEHPVRRSSMVLQSRPSPTLSPQYSPLLGATARRPSVDATELRHPAQMQTRSPQLRSVVTAAPPQRLIAVTRSPATSVVTTARASPTLGPAPPRVVASPLVRPTLAASAAQNGAAMCGLRDDVDLPESAVTGSTGGSSRGSTQGPNNGSAPSAALVAAVQLAAAASATPHEGSMPQPQPHQLQQQQRQILSPHMPQPSPLLQDVPMVSTVGLRRQRWASMTEEEITGSRRTSMDLTAFPSPGMSPVIGWSSGGASSSARPAEVYANDHGARRRWASISDDEAASPMLWPMRRSGRRSLSSTPMMGPSVQPGGGLAKVSEHEVQQPGATPNFMLPPTLQTQPQVQSHTGSRHAMPETYAVSWQCSGWDASCGAGMLGGYGAMQGQTWGQQPQQGWFMRQPEQSGLAQATWSPMANQAPVFQMPQQLEQVGYPSAVPPGMSANFGWAPVSMYAEQPEQQLHGAMAEQHQSEMQMQSQSQCTSRMLNSWTVVWVGERAFRAQATAKEQIESLGFLVKVYRSHDRCSRALDKKGNISSNTLFLVSEADSRPMLEYLQRRRASGLHILVDAEGATQAWLLGENLPELEDDCVTTVCCSWDEVLAALAELSNQALCLGAGALADPTLQPGLAVQAVSGTDAQPQGGFSLDDASHAGENPWTLVWISDQAFKPTAVSMKAQLEGLGCQVKGYKTHKNAARALDKKRALVRTVVLVSGTEAAPFLAYLASRPEISSTPVVVEATSRSVPIREGPTIQITESFDGACAAVWAVANDPGFA